MFERFTDRARRVTVLAQDEARMLKHGYIGTEHFLLGLIHEHDGVAGQVLTVDFNLDLDAIRGEVWEIVGEGQEGPRGHIPFTPRAKKILDLALREALQLGHNYIGTEHILLGLIREGECVGAQILVKRGLDLNVTRQAVIRRLNGYQAASKPAKPEPVEEVKGTLYVRVRSLQGPGEVSEDYDYALNRVSEWATTRVGVEIDFTDGTELIHYAPHVEQVWTSLA